MYQEYPPCQLLAPYIDKYWEFKGETEYDMHYIRRRARRDQGSA